MRKALKVLGCTLALGLMTTTSVFASPNPTATSDVNVDILGGNYSLEISHALPFGTIEIHRETKTYDTGFDGLFTIEDLRGVDDGWELTVSSGPLYNLDDKSYTFDNLLSLKPVQTITRIDSSVGTNTGLPERVFTSGTRLLNNEAITLLKSNGYGLGVFELGFPEDALSLTADSRLKAGTYAATLKWTLQTVPQEVQFVD